MPLRDYRIHRYVNAFCPTCHEEDPDRPLSEVRRLSGWLADRDGTVWLERGCPDHGLVRTLYDDYGRGMDGMKLPYDCECYRARVNDRPDGARETSVVDEPDTEEGDGPTEPPTDGSGTLLIDFR